MSTTKQDSMIRSRAPVRFDMGGGPTDVDPFKSREGGVVVNAALSLFANVELTPRNDSQIVITSADLNQHVSYPSISSIDLNGELRLVKAAVKHVPPSFGVDILTRVETPLGSGLGSSASLAIALLAALRACRAESATIEGLVQDALYVENVMLNNVNGGQDQYAAALGGFNSFSFDRDNVTVQPINMNDECLKSLEARSVMCFAGVSRVSGNILDLIMESYSRGNSTTIAALRTMKECTARAIDALQTCNLESFGEQIRLIGETQQSYHPEIAPPFIREIYALSRSHGAIGSKMAGAGGGGCVYFFCEHNKAMGLTRALVQKGLQILPVRFVTQGVSVQ